jgi:hypothetical protein
MNVLIFGEFWGDPEARMTHWPADYVIVVALDNKS